MDTVKAQIRELYKAGKVTFPHQVEELTGMATIAGHATGGWQGQSGSAGDPPSLRTAIQMNEEFYELLYRVIETWHDAAYAVVNIADDFVATDDLAGEAFEKLKGDLGTRPIDLPSLPAKPGQESS